MKRLDALRAFSRVRTDEPLIMGVGHQCFELHYIGHSDLNMYQVNMPYPTPIALGLALALPDQKVIAMEGDGSTLAGLSSFATIATVGAKNFIKIVWDNEAWLAPGRHGSGHLGPLPTATAGATDLAAIARAAGVKNVAAVDSEAALSVALRSALSEDGPHCIVAKVDKSGEPTEPVRYGVTESAIRFRRALIDLGLIDAGVASTQLKDVLPERPVSEGASLSRVSEILSTLRPHFPSDGPRPSLESAATIYEGMLLGGIDLAVYLPDSAGYLLHRFVSEDASMASVSVTREDEGLAIAMGAFIGGRTPCLIMEGAGMGLCYLALALGFQHRMGAVIVSTHSAGLGERLDYNASIRYVVDPLLPAIGIPHYMARSASDAAELITDAAATLRGQACSVSIQLPRRVLWTD